jgi:hypothetical protein
MLDLNINRLNLNIADAAGQEHRIRPITMRAVAILADRLEERWAAGGWEPNGRPLDSLSVPPIGLDLNRMSDEQAASAIANALLKALT